MLSACGTLLELVLKHERNEEADELARHGQPAEAIDVFHRSDTKPCAMDVGCCENLIGRLSENGLFSVQKSCYMKCLLSRKGE
ncbi:unnamed protein product [Spirodela intermedia]|uniref:Uncharacterized protein n=1 Tax=Spirodela intermedia TaxID=51605 RepID=A0A7I8IQK2_SPIIN|nr:unnamed protein product [Spirodela intermedia]CAA6660199.1 unnamed protein product [Spirodela intermedia]